MNNAVVESLILRFILKKENEKAKYLFTNLLKNIFNHLFLVKTVETSHLSSFTIISDAICFLLKPQELKQYYSIWINYKIG